MAAMLLSGATGAGPSVSTLKGRGSLDYKQKSPLHTSCTPGVKVYALPQLVGWRLGSSVHIHHDYLERHYNSIILVAGIVDDTKFDVAFSVMVC
jgi:hypothetical protein